MRYILYTLRYVMILHMLDMALHLIMNNQQSSMLGLNCFEFHLKKSTVFNCIVAVTIERILMSTD